MTRTSLAVLALALLTPPVAAQGVPGDSSAPAPAALTLLDTTAAQTVSLAEAIRMAARVQPQMVQARASVIQSDARIRSAWGAYLPSVSLSANGSRSSNSTGTRVDPQTGQVISGNSQLSAGTNLSASVDLFTGFRRGAESRSAKANGAAAEASLTNTRYQQALTTTNAFFDVLAAQQLVGVRASSVARAEQQLKTSVAKLHAGSATRSDSLRSLVTLGQAQLQLAQAKSQLIGAEAELGRLVGLDGLVAAQDDSSFYWVSAPVDSAALRAEAVSHSPQVLSAQANASAAQASVKAAQAAYWPSLTLSGSLGWNGSRSQNLRPGDTSLDPLVLYNNRQLALRLSWTLFNGFNREQQITVQKANADVAQANAAAAERQVQASLTSQLAQLAAARDKIEITRTSVAAAEEDLRVVQERYRLGASTIVDVLTSQEALNQAEVDAVTARFDYLRAKAQLEALIGRNL